MRASDRAALLAHDTDPFARWQAGHELAMDSLIAMANGDDPDRALTDAVGDLLADAARDPAFVALCLRLPAEDEIAAEQHRRGVVPNPNAIHVAREGLAARIAARHARALHRIVDEMAVPGPYSPDAAAAARRALRVAAVALLTRTDGGETAELLWTGAGNMTERMGALASLVSVGRGQRALDRMAAQFGDNRLVMDKWFAVQAARRPPTDAVRLARRLSERPDFDWKNPNRFRALIGGLAANHAAFHAADGAGYDFVAGWLERLDPVNPQIAARMTTVFETWPHYDARRRDRARAALTRLANRPGLSRNTAEMVTRILAAGR